MRGRLRFAAAILAVACASATPDPVGSAPDAESQAFLRRAVSFYSALRGRPIDAFETYEDERLRSYFATPEDFSDWYADLANRVRDSDMRLGRPEEVRILEVRFEAGDALVDVVLIGPNERPLRLRDVKIEVYDVWGRSEGTWMLRPR